MSGQVQIETDLSIIIVNWNTRNYLTTCLENLPHASAPYISEVLVVDNASSDGSQDAIRERFPDVNLIANSENVGFASANNQAARQARGRYLLMLNPDTEPMPSSIAGLLAYADDHPEIGALGPHLLNSDGSDQRSCWRGYPGLGMAFVNAFYLWKLPWLPITWLSDYRPSELARPRPVDHLLGACILIRRSAWDQVGAFDEDYFLGSEETDWCYRAQQLGWLLIYHPNCVVIHHGQKSIKQQPISSQPRMYSGYREFYWKRHKNRAGLVLLSGIQGVGAIIRIGLWIGRWIVARGENDRKEAGRMIMGYLQVIGGLGEIKAPVPKAATVARPM